MEKYELNSEFVNLNYRRGYLTLNFELRFEYYPNSEKFLIDVHSYQEGWFHSFYNLQASDDFRELSLQVDYEDEEEKQREVFLKSISDYTSVKMAHRILHEVNNQGRIIGTDKKDSDNITILFEKDKFESLQLYRYKDSKMIEALDIKYKDNRLSYWRTYVKEHGVDNIHEELTLKKFSVHDFKINYIYEGGSGSFELQISKDVYQIIEDLMNIEGVLDFNKT